MSYVNTGFIQPDQMDDEEDARIRGIIAEVRPMVHSLCQLLYGDQEVRLLRRDFTTGDTIHEYLTPEEIAALNRLPEVEDRLIRSYSPMAVRWANTFTKSRTHPTLDYDDYFQEACMAIADVAWCYNGTTLLKTYIQTAIMNRLQDVARLGPLSMISPEVYRMRGKVHKEIDPQTKIDDVLDRFGVTGHRATTIRRAMAGTVHSSQHADEGLDLHDIADDSEPMTREWEQLREAVRLTPLSQFQRDLFEAFFSGEQGFQAKVARRNQNGATGDPYRGKPFSRQYANLEWHRAVEAVRRTYDQHAA